MLILFNLPDDITIDEANAVLALFPVKEFTDGVMTNHTSMGISSTRYYQHTVAPVHRPNQTFTCRAPAEQLYALGVRRVQIVKGLVQMSLLTREMNGYLSLLGPLQGRGLGFLLMDDVTGVTQSGGV